MCSRLSDFSILAHTNSVRGGQFKRGLSPLSISMFRNVGFFRASKCVEENEQEQKRCSLPVRSFCLSHSINDKPQTNKCLTLIGQNWIIVSSLLSPRTLADITDHCHQFQNLLQFQRTAKKAEFFCDPLQKK